jgi:hypothetical protein
MKFVFWKNWGIRGRLITIAVVPATIMFVVISEDVRRLGQLPTGKPR